MGNKKIQKHLLDWYEKNKRDLPWRKTKDPYHIWVSEVMLQQTQVKTVIPYYARFLKKFTAIADLAAANIQEVLKLWEGLGYYARARNLHKAAGIVVAAHKGRVPETYDAFRKLPGVGDYIAAAVLSIAYGQPYAVVDGNVKRVLSRMFLIEVPVNKPASHRIFSDMASRLLETRCPGQFNQALMELGAVVCGPRQPECRSCPVADRCRAYLEEKVSTFPLRIRKKPVPHHHLVAGVIEKKGRYLICRRPSEGLLGGLWEFPGGIVVKGEGPEQACVRNIRERISLVVTVETPLTRVRHAYTHFKISMDVYACRFLSGRVRLNGPTDFAWVTPSQMDNYPFHGANLKFMPLLKTRANM